MRLAMMTVSMFERWFWFFYLLDDYVEVRVQKKTPKKSPKKPAKKAATKSPARKSPVKRGRPKSYPAEDESEGEEEGYVPVKRGRSPKKAPAKKVHLKIAFLTRAKAIIRCGDLRSEFTALLTIM